MNAQTIKTALTAYVQTGNQEYLVALFVEQLYSDKFYNELVPSSWMADSIMCIQLLETYIPEARETFGLLFVEKLRTLDCTDYLPILSAIHPYYTKGLEKDLNNVVYAQPEKAEECESILWNIKNLFKFNEQTALGRV